MKIAIYSIFGHMECLGFLLEALKEHELTVVMSGATDKHKWVEYFKSVYSFEITSDHTYKYDKAIKLNSTDDCLHEYNPLSLIHIDQPTNRNKNSSTFICLTPLISWKECYYTFPVFSPIINFKRTQQVMFVGYFKNSYIDTDLNQFIHLNADFQFIFVVWGDTHYPRISHHKNVQICTNIPATSLSSLLSSSMFILSRKKINDDRFSGYMSLAMSFEIPLIIDAKTAAIYGFPGFNFHKDFCEVGCLSKISQNDYLKHLRDIRQFKHDWQSKNYATLNKLLC